MASLLTPENIGKDLYEVFRERDDKAKFERSFPLPLNKPTLLAAAGLVASATVLLAVGSTLAVPVFLAGSAALLGSIAIGVKEKFCAWKDKRDTVKDFCQKNNRDFNLVKNHMSGYGYDENFLYRVVKESDVKGFKAKVEEQVKDVNFASPEAPSIIASKLTDPAFKEAVVSQHVEKGSEKINEQFLQEVKENKFFEDLGVKIGRSVKSFLDGIKKGMEEEKHNVIKPK